ncbi:GntR family transcriptional regulator [Herbaspirillum lusitanum]|uniref:GntR family transcriptional regulator n=1 Tax=Herbaspirillum lusitanum TaxID=213312 RepID=A0ABW9A6H1_9BURK
MNNEQPTPSAPATDLASMVDANTPWFVPKGVPVARMADQIYRRLRTAILSGEIPARTRLVELDVAARLQVSRTPVREAISRLVSDLLVTPMTYGGVEVVDTAEEQGDIFAIREALEGSAARLAAERITEAELQALDQVLEESMALPLDALAERAVLNDRFHTLILQASRSQRLIQMVEGFREFFIDEVKLMRYTQRDTQTALKHHQEIVAALRAHDGKRAERLARNHLEHSKARLQKPGKRRRS